MSDKEQLEALAKEAKQRLKAARRQKAKIEQDLREAYFFTAPLKEREMLSRSNPKMQGSQIADQQGELMTSLGIETSQDFASHLLGTFMPPNFDWVRRGPGIYTREDDWAAVKDQAQKDDKAILNAIRASNFEAEMYQALYPDISHGTAAVWIDDDIPGASPVMRAVPARELEICVGPWGTIDDRFVVQFHRKEDLQRVLDKEIFDKLPKDLRDTTANKDTSAPVEVVWGFWRQGSDKAVIRWQYVLMVKDMVYQHRIYEGEGSCPLIVGRFGPDPCMAWGVGPAINALPWLRLLDVKSEQTFESADRAIAPPFGYPSDGITNFEDGIERGKAYPMAPGSGRDFVPLDFTSGSAQMEFITLADLQMAIKRMFFVDKPEQLGKTPPSASQFLDEAIEAQKRIGPVGQKFWSELPVGIFHRFRFLLEQAGIIERLTVDDGNALVSTQAYNPAVKSQEMQEVQVATRMLGISRELFPVESQAIIDGFETLEGLIKKSGDELIKFRGKETIEQFMAQMLQGAAEGVMQGDPGEQA